MRKHVFLSGPVKYEKDGGVEWRLRVYQCARENEWVLRVFDPTEYFDYQWDGRYQKTDRQIKEYYLQAIKKSEIVLVNLNGTIKSVGTGMEIQYALDHDIPVIGWGNTDVYPWIRDACTVVFETLEEALDYVQTYYDYDD